MPNNVAAQQEYDGFLFQGILETDVAPWLLKDIQAHKGVIEQDLRLPPQKIYWFLPAFLSDIEPEERLDVLEYAWYADHISQNFYAGGMPISGYPGYYFQDHHDLKGIALLYPQVIWLRADIGKVAAPLVLAHELRHKHQHLYLPGLPEDEHEHDADLYALGYIYEHCDKHLSRICEEIVEKRRSDVIVTPSRPITKSVTAHIATGQEVSNA